MSDKMTEADRKARLAEVCDHVKLHGSIPQRHTKWLLSELERVEAELELRGLAELRDTLAEVVSERDAALAREAKLREAAKWVVDQAYETDDGQSMVVDPGFLRDLRAALAESQEAKR
jgi:hypothetical protein